MVLLVNHSVPTEGIRHREPNVTTNIEGNDIGSGTLYITESFVLWLNDGDQGIQLEYKLICLHAISRDRQNFPHEHLLCHYVGKLPGLNEDNESDEENEDDKESESELLEIRFVPQNKESLQPMFEALANCQTLHPDSDCQLSGDDFEDADDDGSGDGIYGSEDGVAHLTEQGRNNLERLNQLLDAGQGDADITTRTNLIRIANGHDEEPPVDSEQFEDADNMEE
ncbi:unnamed protein product [Lymnaea stagnalis]|uniref:Methylosome subunit pICln n=1 Tax=Lymnaea stagnalis TaxID=6523 RepID=A0AAV2IFD2_LYMST